jgi:hypothetical protein
MTTLSNEVNAAGVDLSSYTPKIKLTTENLAEGTCALSLGNEGFNFIDNRKIVYNLSSQFPLFYATSRKKITIHRMPDPIIPLFLRVFQLPTLEEGDIAPRKPVPHTTAALNRIDLATQTTSDAT